MAAVPNTLPKYCLHFTISNNKHLYITMQRLTVRIIIIIIRILKYILIKIKLVRNKSRNFKIEHFGYDTILQALQN
jgi:uncharacterized membrane protein YkgB